MIEEIRLKFINLNKLFSILKLPVNFLLVSDVGFVTCCCIKSP